MITSFFKKNRNTILQKLVAATLCIALVLGAGLFGQESVPFTEETSLNVSEVSAEPQAQSDIPAYILVGLFYGSTAKKDITISCSKGLSIGTSDHSGFSKTADITAANKIVCAVQNGHIVMKNENGDVLITDCGASMTVWPRDNDRIAINGTVYRGGCQLRVSGSSLTVINVVGMEHYLYGVINSEMNYENELEALKAQAVAARSYAVCQINNHGSYGFDVCTGTHCQVYKGVSGEKTKTTQAVNETKGQVIRSNGVPVKAYYSSNNGGYIMSAYDAWLSEGPRYAYLVAKEDPYTPTYAWTATFTYDELAKLVSTSDKPCGNVLSVEVTKWTEYGNAFELTITGSENTFVYTAEKIRTGFAASRIKSQRFTIVDNTKDSDLYALAGEETVELSSDTVAVLDAEGNMVTLAPTELTMQSEAFKTQIPESAAASGEKTVTFYGTGYGHCIGMSQDGAKEMARRGFTYDQIMKFYYDGVEVY